jgi:hypothetical protein
VSLCYRNWLARSRRFGTSKMDSLLFIEMLSNIGVNRSAKQLRSSVPAALRAPGTGYAERLCTVSAR